ncbi:hypothetical protein OF83DRAFT_1176637 [Amylostereum chailletii]|nr:hypothetical protein OF83DRAFT_1176637 [Amylostereum chailletii]
MFKQWPDHTVDSFNPDHFFKYGGPEVFGSERSQKITQGHGDGPTARLECGCEASASLLDGDEDLLYSVVFRVADETLLLELSALADLGQLPRLSNLDGFCHLDFHGHDDRDNPERAQLMDAVEHVVFYQGKERRWGWELDDVVDRRGWVNSLRLFFATYVPDFDSFYLFRDLGLDWNSINILEIVDRRRLDKLEHALLQF